MIPVLEYRLSPGEITYRYTRVVPGFDMPVRVYVNDQPHWLFPKKDWKIEKIEGIENMRADPNLYVLPMEIKS